MDEHEELMSVLEGWCPRHEEATDDTKLVITHIGGYTEWLYGPNPNSPFVTCPYDLDNVEDVNVWRRPDLVWDGIEAYNDSFVCQHQGAVGFRCDACGAEFWVEATANGDWVGP